MRQQGPERVISVDRGEPRPVDGVQSSMDAAIAGLEHAQGRVEVGPSVRTTPREARALDIQTNGFAEHVQRLGVEREQLGMVAAWNAVEHGGKKYPSLVYPRRIGGMPRYRVTVEQWHGRPDELADAPVWLFDPEAEDFGLDPWRLGDGLDKWPARDDLPDAYELWLASGRSIRGVAADFPVYVQEEHFRALLATRA